MNGKYEHIQSSFDRVYTDGRALQYIDAYWSIEKTARYIKWLNEPGENRTLKDCFRKDPDTAGDFIEFAADCGNKC